MAKQSDDVVFSKESRYSKKCKKSKESRRKVVYFTALIYVKSIFMELNRINLKKN